MSLLSRGCRRTGVALLTLFVLSLGPTFALWATASPRQSHAIVVAESPASESGGHTAAAGVATEEAEPHYGKDLSLLWVLPFVGILLSIALGPILAPEWWEHHYPKVSLFWAVAFAIPFIIRFMIRGDVYTAIEAILDIYIIDYIPFIILLAGLFVAAGGIVLRGTVVGKPSLNVLFILIGTILASWIGTTGAAMVMIRPILRANRHRRARMHIVIFFIFLVANIGGSLTPLGDPPLFLGFLHGVPFQWTFSLLPEMVFVIVLLLGLFYFLDLYFLKREDPSVIVEEKEETEPIRVSGAHNFLYLLGIVGAVLLSGIWKPGVVNLFGVHVGISDLIRNGLIAILAVLAYMTTNEELREANDFDWEPIREVAYLFAGIFMTIIPAIAILRAGEEGHLGFIIRAANSESAYMWLTGTLSSFLDNAPTYLTFFNTALGKLHLSEGAVADFLAQTPLPFFEPTAGDPALIAQILKDHGESLSYFKDLGGAEAIRQLGENLMRFEGFLKAVSIGAVFMGANTYIGNAPNFMVRKIAMQDGVRMPSFFGYMLWSLAILIPTFVVVSLVFFVWLG